MQGVLLLGWQQMGNQVKMEKIKEYQNKEQPEQQICYFMNMTPQNK